MQIQPYLFFDGRCEEAVAFYREALGAEVVMLSRFSEAPAMPEGDGDAGCMGGPPPPGDKIMHGELRIGGSTILVSDGLAQGRPEFKGVSLALSVAGGDEARRAFDALAEGGRVEMPLGPSFFATSFGMVEDRFGVGWMVVAPSQGG